jgi:hypothetical protein
MSVWHFHRARTWHLKRRSHPMSERTIKGGQIQVSDIVELALGSIVILLVLLLWAYVPA